MGKKRDAKEAVAKEPSEGDVAAEATILAPDHEAGKSSDSPEDSSSGPSSSSDDEADEEDLDGDDGEDGKTDLIDVDFEFFDPKPVDYHGVKALLKSYTDEVEVDVTGLVDLVISQTTVGTVIKTAEDESPIGIISALNLERYKEAACISEVKEFLLAKCPSGSPAASKLSDLLEKEPARSGLLISERLINVPMELAPPLYNGLFDEVQWATEDEPTEELRKSFKFNNYLVMTRVYEEDDRPSKNHPPQHKKRRRENESERKGLLYVKPEDEIFHQLSSWSFTFPVQAEALAARETKSLRPHRLVMCVRASEVPEFRKKLEKLVKET